MRRIAIWILIIILIVILTIKYTRIQHNYKEQLNYYQLFHDGVFNEYCLIYDYYFDEYFRYPYDKEELEIFFKMNQEDYFQTLKTIFHDPFSQDKSDILYVPLYSRISKMREGFAIISTGIDGEINSFFKDTTYIDDIKEIEFYNDINDPDNPSFFLADTVFNLYDYFFGRKDLLLCYKDGVSQFINNNRNWSLSTFYRKIKNIKRIEYQRITFILRGKVSAVTNEYIEVKEDSLTANCYMYNGRNYDIKPGDTINLASFFRGKVDPKNRIIILEDCILK
jgi:hypothetical protein